MTAATGAPRSWVSVRTRWALLLSGVIVLAVGFVGLVAADNRLDMTSPWRLVGVTGLVLVLVALGSPRAAGPPDDDPRRVAG